MIHTTLHPYLLSLYNNMSLKYRKFTLRKTMNSKSTLKLQLKHLFLLILINRIFSRK